MFRPYRKRDTELYFEVFGKWKKMCAAVGNDHAWAFNGNNIIYSTKNVKRIPDVEGIKIPGETKGCFHVSLLPQSVVLKFKCRVIFTSPPAPSLPLPPPPALGSPWPSDGVFYIHSSCSGLRCKDV